MIDKKNSRLRRASKTRYGLARLEAYRLCVFRTNQHIYASIVAPKTGNVVAQASTLDPDVKKIISEQNIEKAAQIASVVGEVVGKRALAAGFSKVSFDRSGYAYHGRVQKLADGARNAGLSF